MSGFPGCVYDGEGIAMDGQSGDLTQDRIDACEGRSMVTAGELVPVAWLWLLEDGATWSAVPQGIRDGAVTLVESGQGIVILSRRHEEEADVRDGLLSLLDLAKAPDDAAGHA